MDLNFIYNNLLSGNGSILTEDTINYMNQEAYILYNSQELNPQQINDLKLLILICNITYNRTDMTVLPIEDGFYDLLLEKYKVYDPNFQVGSAVVDLVGVPNTELDETKHLRNPISFFEQPKRDDIHEVMYENIMRVGKPILTPYDILPNPPIESEYISKRTHNTEHNHPSLVGTLDKAKFVTIQDAIDAGVADDPNVVILERDFFMDHIKKGIYNPNRKISIVCELKYDGISVEADCTTEVLSARTRGDTGIGVASDITPILKAYPFKNAWAMNGHAPVGVKFEAIMTKSNLFRFNQIRNRKYANCRSAIVGLFGASDAYLFRDFITLVPLAMDLDNFEYDLSNRIEEIEFLNRVFVSHGEPLRYSVFSGTVPEVLYAIKAFWDEAKNARDFLDFMYDGIVVSYIDKDIREALGRKNYINKYSMAVKFDPFKKQTIFRGYTYEVGQHGNITPMVHYDPVEFLGTIHTKSTGSSLNRFNELGLKYGDFINVTYVNDVMPYVSRVECDHNRNNPNPVIPIITNCPICGTELVVSDSGKSLLCPNKECPGRSSQRMVNMFSKMNIKGFALASFSAIADRDHLYKLYDYVNGKPLVPRPFYISILGDAYGNQFSDVLDSFMRDKQKDYIVMGALGFTSIAHKKWQSILQKIRLVDIYNLANSSEVIDKFIFGLKSAVPNIGDVTAKTIASEWGFFVKDVEFILNYFCLEESFGMSNEGKLQIRFTGCRNKQLSEQLISAGYDADDNSSYTKNTDILLIPYEGFSSTKVNKALSNPKTKIIPIDEFMSNMEKYLN